MATEKRRGRPPSERGVKDKKVPIYLTEEDADELTRVAKQLGLRSRSQLIAAILERLNDGGWTGIVFAKLGWQIATRREERAKEDGEKLELDFGAIIRPLTALPTEDDPSPEELNEWVEALQTENKTKEKAC